jgi:hypothetical protein
MIFPLRCSCMNVSFIFSGHIPCGRDSRRNDRGEEGSTESAGRVSPILSVPGRPQSAGTLILFFLNLLSGLVPSQQYLQVRRHSPNSSRCTDKRRTNRINPTVRTPLPVSRARRSLSFTLTAQSPPQQPRSPPTETPLSSATTLQQSQTSHSSSTQTVPAQTTSVRRGFPQREVLRRMDWRRQRGRG